jgi:rod shape-determining protein MreC
LNFFNFNIRKAIILILIALLPLLSINMEQKTTQNLWFAQPISFFSGIIQSFFAGISQSVRGTTAEYVNLINIKSENAKLMSEVNELKAFHTKYQENVNELDRLRKLLDFRTTNKMKLVPAQVIGRDLTVDHQTITINKGLADGLKAQQAVITTQGAVGYIFKPETHSSHVMLLTDRYAVTDAVVQKTRSHAIVEGLGKDSGSLQYVERDEVVQIGDLIVTGGLDKIYPNGFPLATVSEILTKPNSSVRMINVKPVVESDKIEEVFVVMSAENEDFTTPLEAQNAE